MSSSLSRDEQHLQELLAGKVLGDLSTEEMQEFGELFSAPHSKDLQELEQAAASLQWALSDASKPALPDSLRRRIASASESLVVAIETQPNRLSVARRIDASSISEFRWREGIAWLAVAASLFIASQLWLSNNPLQQPSTKMLSAAESRSAMLAQMPDLIRVDWSSGKTPFDNSVSGDVVWSNTNQAGFMRFVGMPPNDPAQEQYQLWIIDPERDAEPIDGGVFDIASNGEVVVPIQAKLKVLKPAAFAITIEKPGGVVVSTQERLPLLAQVVN